MSLRNIFNYGREDNLFIGKVDDDFKAENFSLF